MNTRHSNSFMKMAKYFSTALAVVCFITISFCGASPVPDTVKETKIANTTTVAGALKIPHWFRSAFASMKRPLANNGFQDSAVFDLVNKQDSTFKPADDALPVFIHKKDEETGMKITLSSPPNIVKVHPFLRTKRSVCTTPANLTEKVKDLNRRLNASQFVGLNPEESTSLTPPTNEPTTCPTNATGDWWPRPEVNLRSTCPWKLQQIDLGANAFPRYVNNAICMCDKGCVGTSITMRCKEVTYDVMYFLRTGCQDGLAVMETRNRTINIGCHCVGANTHTEVPDENSE